MGNLAERRALHATLALYPIAIRHLGHVLGSKPRGLDVGRPLIVEALGRTSSPGTPPGVRTREPGWPDATLDLLSLMTPKRLIKGRAAVLADDEGGSWSCGSHRVDRADEKLWLEPSIHPG
jgi:hypothetical protein